MSTIIRRSRALAVVLGIAVMTTLAVAPAASAATLTRSTLSASVSGTTVTATTRIAASPATWASLAGICARSSSGNHYDFPLVAATLSTTGVSITKSRSLPAGTYTYWACAKINGAWNAIGATQTFTVGNAVAGGSAPSGQAMPVGDLPGWKQVFTDDFTTSVGRGSFPGSAYASKWTGYDGFTDSYGIANYQNSAISTSGGLMDVYLRTENGKVITAAPSPIVTKAWAGQTYGRYTMRFKSDSLAGYKLASLLWPVSGDWNQGEVDFPEGGLDSTIYAFNHCLNNPAKNCFWATNGTKFTGWHTATIEWSPGKLSFILDGATLGTTTTSVPTAPMRWILQLQSGSTGPAASVSGHFQLDWVAVYTYNG